MVGRMVSLTQPVRGRGQRLGDKEWKGSLCVCPGNHIKGLAVFSIHSTFPILKLTFLEFSPTPYSPEGLINGPIWKVVCCLFHVMVGWCQPVRGRGQRLGDKEWKGSLCCVCPCNHIKGLAQYS